MVSLLSEVGYELRALIVAASPPNLGARKGFLEMCPQASPHMSTNYSEEKGCLRVQVLQANEAQRPYNSQFPGDFLIALKSSSVAISVCFCVFWGYNSPNIKNFNSSRVSEYSFVILSLFWSSICFIIKEIL